MGDRSSRNRNHRVQQGLDCQQPRANSRFYIARAPRPVYIFVTGIWGAKYNSEFRYGGWKFPKPHSLRPNISKVPVERFSLGRFLSTECENHIECEGQRIAAEVVFRRQFAAHIARSRSIHGSLLLAGNQVGRKSKSNGTPPATGCN